VSGYEIYAAKSETEPADLAYTLLASPAAADVSYVHSGLTAGDVWWYKIRAVFGSLGAGPWSDVKSHVAGAADWTAHIDMSSGSLDADFLDPMRASGSTDARVSADGGVTYTVPALYVANDNTNLYVAMDFQGRTPGGYSYDRFVVWVDNTSTSAGGAAITNSDAKLVQNATVNGSIEGLAYKRVNAALGGNAGVALNATTWAGYDGGDWIGRPTVPENTTVLKFSIPLAGIGGAGKGTELKVLGSFAMGWNDGSDVRLGGVVPAAAATGSGNAATSTITMDKALSYTVK
ncbi:MAG: hypothetical protein FWF29_08205, partial [Treponema sp.]|nr:hypothetical protein [Treponema sp.]